jgi:hypothetical protein
MTSLTKRNKWNKTNFNYFLSKEYSLQSVIKDWSWILFSICKMCYILKRKVRPFCVTKLKNKKEIKSTTIPSHMCCTFGELSFLNSYKQTKNMLTILSQCITVELLPLVLNSLYRLSGPFSLIYISRFFMLSKLQIFLSFFPWNCCASKHFKIVLQVQPVQLFSYILVQNE